VYKDILYEVADPVATISLNRPDRLNAWTGRMGDELRHAVAQAEADSSVVAIVITGSGRGFCAGADMQSLKNLSEGGAAGAEETDLSADPGDPGLAEYRGRHSYLFSVRKPVIAVINGPCAGMGMPLVLSCDMRFASDRAIFTTAFSRRGLIAEWGLSWLLPLVVGPSHAFDLILSARRFDAAEAADLGMVNRVFPHDELMAETRAYIEDLATNCSPASLQIMKRQIYEDLTLSLDAAEKKAIKLMSASFDRPDFKEGVASFLEKRPPKFERI
jgi:enoyl-CoA hydratase/carnithine racemase